MTIHIVIADDHSVVRQGLRMFLGLDSELEVVGEAADGAEALRLARQLRPDVVLMDLLMPVMDGITATAAIRSELPGTEVLALTSVLEDASVVGAVRAGAIGYLLKDTQADALCQAIKAAAAGQVQLTPRAAARLMQAVSTPENPEELTERETYLPQPAGKQAHEASGNRARTGLRCGHKFLSPPPAIAESEHLLAAFTRAE